MTNKSDNVIARKIVAHLGWRHIQFRSRYNEALAESHQFPVETITILWTSYKLSKIDYMHAKAILETGSPRGARKG